MKMKLKVIQSLLSGHNHDVVAGPVAADADVGVPELLPTAARPGPHHPLRRSPADGSPGLSALLCWESCEDGTGRPRSCHRLMGGCRLLIFCFPDNKYSHITTDYFILISLNK